VRITEVPEPLSVWAINGHTAGDEVGHRPDGGVVQTGEERRRGLELADAPTATVAVAGAAGAADAAAGGGASGCTVHTSNATSSSISSTVHTSNIAHSMAQDLEHANRRFIHTLDLHEQNLVVAICVYIVVGKEVQRVKEWLVKKCRE
jgi:hypothetical protein